MKGYRYFIEQGDRYVMKRRYGFALVISIGLAFCGFGGYVADMPVVMWISVVIALLCLVSIWAESMVIDTAKKEIVVTRGLIARQTTIPLADIRHFEMARMTHYLITVNTSLNVWYIRDNKDKVAMISNGVTVRAMQNLLNEIDEIIEKCRISESGIVS